jgi:hypothetical protein
MHHLPFCDGDLQFQAHFEFFHEYIENASYVLINWPIVCKNISGNSPILDATGGKLSAICPQADSDPAAFRVPRCALWAADTEVLVAGSR